MSPEEARAVLGLGADATIADVEDMHRLRARIMHPDRYAGRPEAEVRFATTEFQRLGVARTVLLAALGASRDARPRAGTRSRISIGSELARNGGVCTAPTPDGGTTRVRIPAGVADGAVLRVAPGASYASSFEVIVVVESRRPEAFEEFVSQRSAQDWGGVPDAPPDASPHPEGAAGPSLLLVLGIIAVLCVAVSIIVPTRGAAITLAGIGSSIGVIGVIGYLVPGARLPKEGARRVAGLFSTLAAIVGCLILVAFLAS